MEKRVTHCYKILLILSASVICYTTTYKHAWLTFKRMRDFGEHNICVCLFQIILLHLNDTTFLNTAAYYIFCFKPIT